jgi:uncharacterized membrane protein (DUF2068 family)
MHRDLGAAGVRTIALFEMAKGLLVLLAGLGLLALIHRDAQHAAEAFVRHLHLDPASRYPEIFIRAAGRLTDRRLLLLAGGAFAYAVLRLAEAYGLWHLRPWAEWIAIVSSGLYLPVEVYELWHRPTRMRAFVLLTNALIVAGLLHRRRRSRAHTPA